MKKVITDEELNQIEERLNAQYGAEGEDWAGGKVKIRGDEKYYAVKAPSADAWVMFKTQRDEHFTKIALNKKTNIKLDQVKRNLVIDCLVDDVPGCATHEDLKKDSEVKPGLVEALVDNCQSLHDSGLDGLKKNQ
jgi:hypothetical protein